jgi:regulator of protease activity HflC (stomatin/prohibitin superfamily)
VEAVSESVMREIIAASNLSPILNRDRGLIADTALQNIQATLDEYESGINIVRVNLDRADPPPEVIDAFREVQAAEQERDRLQRQADAYANRVLAEARGEAAQLLEQAEGYRAQVVNEAIGEASRFIAVAQEFNNAPEVTQRRLYLETIERTLGDVDKVILDDVGGSNGQGVLPYLPLNEVRRAPPPAPPPEGRTDAEIRYSAVVVVLLGIVGLSSLFIVDEREKALVLQFGQIRQVVEEPGLGFKVPFIQEVVKYDGRILSLDTDTIEVTPSDDRRLVVDAFARYRIADVVQFRQAVGVGGIRPPRTGCRPSSTRRSGRFWVPTR